MTGINPILKAALEAAQQGLSVIPVRPGTKQPAVPWKQYQRIPASTDQIMQWWATPGYGLGIITGKVSGNLEMLELEGRASHLEDEIIDLAEASGLLDLAIRIFYQGWTETSPSGGIHYYYRTKTPPAGNTRLARNAEGKVTAETRGEGGYVVIAPTPGSFHETGQPWENRTGSPRQILTLTDEEHEALHALFQAQNEYLPPDAQQTTLDLTDATLPGGYSYDPGTRPGDDFEAKTSWPEILQPHGWTPVHQSGNTIYWRRPGKPDGISATTGHAQDRDRLYVFTTSTDFEPEIPYTKFGAWALLNHGGDHHEAARKLHADGYGQQARQLVPTIPGSNPQDTLGQTETTGTNPDSTEPPEGGSETLPPAAAVAGNLALVVDNPNPETSAPARTEDFDALWLADTYQHQIAYCPEWGKWLTWNGHTWQPQPEGGGYVRELAKHLYRQLSDKTKQEASYKTKVLARSGISNRLAMAETDLRLVVSKTILDQHPYQLNTPGGIIDLKTGNLTPPNPEAWHTKTTLVTPQRQETPMWDKFLTQTFNGDTQIIDYMQRLAGYSATGVVADHVLPFLYGPGGNGKSVLLDTLMAILGDYATSAPARFLMAGPASHETEIARLDGQRLVICSEINEHDKFDEAKVKLLTGGDRLTARYMRQDYFTFTPTHKLWLMGNHQPKVTSGGPSFWRRLQLVGFTYSVPANEIIENLDQKLIKNEGPGILQWVIDGAIKYLNSGLNTPESVKTASKEYATEEDALSRFVEECLIIGGGEYARVSSAEMNQTYTQWCNRENENEISNTALARALRNTYGLGKIKGRQGNLFSNVTLANTGDDTSNDPWSDLGGGR